MNEPILLSSSSKEQDNWCKHTPLLEGDNHG